MTDSLDVLKDKSHSCALVYPTKKRIFSSCLFEKDTILAPEVPNLQPSTRGAVSRSNSRDQDGVENQTRSESNLLYESLHAQHQNRTSSTIITEIHQPLSDYRQISIEQETLAHETEDENFPRRYRNRFEDFKIPYREYRQLSIHSKDSTDGKVLLPYEEKISTRCIDTVTSDSLSLSLSPVQRDKPFQYRGIKTTRVDLRKPLEHLSAEDLQEIAGGDDSVEQENVTDYCYGGYKPIEIGEEIAHRYTVIRKLGFGHFSTVWLCKDRQDPTSIQYVAVKIVKAAEMFNCVAQDEIKLLRCIMNGDPNHPGRNHVIQMLDYFQTRSINGHHTCISFELMGPSLLHLLVQSDYRGIHISGVRNIIKQVLKGLSYLHDICKIIHTDIKPENILIKVKDSYVRNLVDTSSRYNELGIQMPRTYVSAETWENYLYIRDPVDLNIKAGPSKENDNLSRSSSFPKDEDDKRTTPERHNAIKKLKQPLYISPNIEVKIADLGNACWEDRHFSPNIQTKQYRALEVILGADYSTPADIWSVGCMAFELATAEYLFNPKRSQYLTSAEDHILLICELLGSIPNYIAQRGTAAHNYFDAGGNLKIYADHQLHLRIWKTEDVLVEKYKWKRVDAIPFATLIESMIEPDPELRVTATMALQSEWFNEG